jgi:hypothetical protein
LVSGEIKEASQRIYEKYQNFKKEKSKW